MSEWKSRMLLLLTAMIWGCAFVAQSAGMDHIGPWTFTCLRSILASAVLASMLPVLDRIRGTDKENIDRSFLWRGGISAGLLLASASYFQQAGIVYTTAGKAAFLTSMYVVLVPLISVFFGKRTSLQVWIAAGMAVIALYLLCIRESFSLQTGDRYEIICAFLFAFHILVVDRAAGTDGIRLSCIQFLTVSVFCLPGMIAEKPQIAQIIAAAVPLLYAGICSSCIGYTLQIIGQKNVSPSEAVLLLSLESVFALIAGFLLRHEILSARELAGCVLMFAAVLLSQIRFVKKDVKSR